jgi:hypothetical protein
VSEIGIRTNLLIQNRCLACGHLWRKSSAADHLNCPICSSPNWASVDTLERAQRIDPIEQRERGERERERGQRETERTKARRELSQAVKALLTKHDLTLPEETAEITVETIAKEIVKCRVSEPRPTKQKDKKKSPRDRLLVARRHAKKLLKYTESPPSHAESIPKRSMSLHKALDDWGPVISLASATPRVHVPRLLDRLQARGLSKRELAGLVQALGSLLSKDGRSTGRPREETARVIRAGCIAWLRAGRSESYWQSEEGPLTGPLPEFVRDLFSLCPENNFQVTDAALHWQLKVALPYCESSHSRRTDLVAAHIRRVAKTRAANTKRIAKFLARRAR